MRRTLDLYLYLMLSAAAVGLSVLSLFSPTSFFQAGVLVIALALGVLVYLFPATFLGLVVLSLVTSPDLFIESKVAGLDVKAVQRLVLLLTLAASIYRYGAVRRSNPPIAALLVMFLITLVAADMLPFLTHMQMVRSMIALILPFLFLHCVYRREAIDRYLLIVALMPVVSVIGGLLLEMAGIGRFVRGEYTGALRLRGMNASATLAYFAYISFFVCVYQVVTAARTGYYWLAGINLLIILLTGTRMPMLTAAMLIAAVMLFAPQNSFRFSARVKVAIVGAILLGGVLFVLWPSLEARVTEAGWSGRDLIWELYLAEIEKNPWFGRGIGAGTVLLPNVEDWKGTSAAHNEYLRVIMDTGIAGLLIFLVAMILWVRSELRFMRRDESVLFLGFMFGFAIYSVTGNSLSAQPTPVVFFALALTIHRARQRRVETAWAQATGPQIPVPATSRTITRLAKSN